MASRKTSSRTLLCAAAGLRPDWPTSAAVALGVSLFAFQCTGDVKDPAGSAGARSGSSGAGGASKGGSGGQSGSAGTKAGTGGASGSSGSGGSGASGGAVGSGGLSGSGGQAGGASGASGAAGSVGGGSDAAVDPCKDRIVCDDFEKATSGSSPAAPFKVRQTKGRVVVDNSKAFSGTRSVHVSVDATTSSDTYRRAYMTIDGAPLIPLPNNSIYGRFMIWVPRIPDKTVHWTVAHGDGPAGSLSATYNYGGMGNLMANYYRNTSPLVTDCWQTKAQNFPTGAWTCVAFQFNGPNNEMRFWLNGTEVPELHVLGNSKTDATCTEKGIDGRWLAPQFSNISLGYEAYQHDVGGAQEAWLDDVILDDTPIACP